MQLSVITDEIDARLGPALDVCEELGIRAVELAPRGVRVNAVAPGFFVGEQNRALLLDESGALTARGEKIVAATPAARFGEPHELAGTVIWLCSAASSFVTGVVVPVDGGFDAFGGV